MKLRSLSLVALASLFISGHAHASALAFTNLSQEDVDNIEGDMLSNTTLHSVTSPSSLGTLFGFELGLTGGLTRSPNIDDAAKQVSSDANVKSIPHVGLLGALSIPFGLTAELTLLPKLTFGDLSYQQYAAALKWTLTDSVLSGLPLNIAMRGFLAKSELSFKQTVTDPLLGSADINVKADNQVTGLQIFVSPPFPILEPYAGVGFLYGKGTLGFTGTTTSSIFSGGENSMSSSPSCMQTFIGLDVHLLVLRAGLEYSRAFATDSFTGKLSFKF